MLGHEGPNVTVEGFDGPLELLLELVEEKKLDVLTVRLGDLADAYLTRVRALDALPADEVASFLALASRLVLLKARSLLPSLAPLTEEDEFETEEELRARLVEYAVVRERAGQLGDRLRSGERAFHREGGSSAVLPPRGGEVTALAAAWTRVLALASRTREEEQMAPGERYSVEDRTSEIELIVGEHGEVTFTELLGPAPTLGWAVVTFIALLDLYRRIVIDLEQNELFTDIVIRKKERPTPMTEAPA
jgi:segregation and condensation protein A